MTYLLFLAASVGRQPRASPEIEVSRSPALGSLVTLLLIYNHGTVNIRNDSLSHLCGVHGRHHRSVGNVDHKRQASKQNQGIF